MKRIKYLATYHGPSYDSGGWSESLDGFKSLDAAKVAMDNRQGEFDYVTTFKENSEGNYVIDSSDTYVRFPATTSSDIMELYKVIGVGEFGQLERAAEPTYRLVIGNRGGVVVEKY